MTMKKILSLIPFAVILASVFCTQSCTKKVELTRIMLEDSIRHYYPLVQGTDLVLMCRIANVGEAPLVLTDIQPSCGCIVEDLNSNNIIPPGKIGNFRFTYRSERNSGYVKHSIRFFGNIEPEGIAMLKFDVNVVPPALGSPDYEELHKEREEYDIAAGIKSLVDGEANQRGYWTNDNEYSRGHTRYYWKRSE